MHWELSLTLPRHGDRPFEIAHLDHSRLDVELADSRTGHRFGKPWATFLTDAFSRRVLAVYLTFDEPSYRSAMMVLRECVHRHNRLPELVVVDWGPEFRSTYFETLLARYECEPRHPAQGQATLRVSDRATLWHSKYDLCPQPGRQYPGHEECAPGHQIR